MFDSWRAKRQIQKLIQSWQMYRQVVTKAHAAERIESGEEDNFLQLKADIASQLQSLTEILTPSASVEANSHISGMTGLLQGQVTLKPTADSEWDQEQFSRTWQLHFLYLNKLKSMRLDQQRRPKVDPHVPVPSGYPGMYQPQNISFRKVPRVVKIGLIVIVLLALGYWGLGIRWDGEDKLVIQNHSFLGQAVGNILSSINALLDDVVSLLSPVIVAYGSIVSLVLIGILLLSLGYWVFIHS